MLRSTLVLNNPQLGASRSEKIQSHMSFLPMVMLDSNCVVRLFPTNSYYASLSGITSWSYQQTVVMHPDSRHGVKLKSKTISIVFYGSCMWSHLRVISRFRLMPAIGQERCSDRFLRFNLQWKVRVKSYIESHLLSENKAEYPRNNILNTFKGIFKKTLLLPSSTPSNASVLQSAHNP